MRRVLSAMTVAGALAAGLAAGSVPGRAASAPATGVVRGRIQIQRPLSAAPATPGAAAVPAEVRREAVVYFEEAPPGEAAPPTTRARLRQVNETFVPHVLAVTTGSTVDFPNDDKTYHNVFSLSKTKRFDLGRYAAGKSKSVVFDRPGIVRVFCDIHSHMNAFILVFGHRYFSVTDAEGRYRIEQVPAGTYRVTAWYEGIAQQTERVTIAGGATADLDFSLR
jgi:plastocyanin